MGKNKLKRFAANDLAENVIQEGKSMFSEIKGKWNELFFKRNIPIVLEIGCGNGEYTIGLAENFIDKNFIGIDIKGARIWNGSQSAIQKQLQNVGFLRNRVEFLADFFEKDEISEIWITFPDPQLKENREKHRLTHPRFLNIYRSFLKSGGIVHLKTDSFELFEYTLGILDELKIEIVVATNDLYQSEYSKEHFGILTKYEKMYLNIGKKNKLFKILFVNQLYKN